MDKKTLEAMGFRWCGFYMAYEPKQKDAIRIIAEKCGGVGYNKFILEIDYGSYEYPLYVNTKFDLEQLLKILGE